MDFSGASFSFEELSVIGTNVLRLRFRTDPVAITSLNSNDALNPDNYVLTGPTTISVVGITPAFGDPQGVDIALSAALSSGTWVLTGRDALESRDGFTLQDPKFLSVVVTPYAPTEPVHGGAENDDQPAIIRKFFNPALKGKNWDALLAGLAAGDSATVQMGALASKQLYLSTASSEYLDRQANDQGVARPPGLGMLDDEFRKYAITIANNKLTLSAILEVLEVFYGPDSIRATSTSEVPEPYIVNDKDDLQIEFDDNNTVSGVKFDTKDFANPAESSALEVVGALNKAFRNIPSEAYAVVYRNPTDDLNYIKIYSGTLGLNSKIQIHGGKAQNSLRFPTRLDVYVGTPTWDLTYDTLNSELTFTTTNSATIKLYLVQVGDYANVFGDDFLAINRGSWTITAVSETYIPSYVGTFTVSMTGGLDQSGAGAYAEDGLKFFRPTIKTAQAGARTVSAVQTDDIMEVRIPVSTTAVTRQPTKAAYLQPTVVKIVSEFRRLVSGELALTLNNTTDLAVGNHILVDGLRGVGTLPTITAADTGAHLTATSLASIWSILADTNGTGTRYHQALKLVDGRAFLIAGESYNGVSATDRVTTETFTVNSSFTSGDGSIGYNYTYTLDTDLPASRKHFTASLLSDSGRVFVYGGINNASGPFGDAWFFVPGVGGVGIWVTTTSGDTRAGHIATVLDDGSVIVTGGVSGGVGLASARVFNPVATTWTTLASMEIARAQHAQIMIATDKLFVSGGRTFPSGSLDYIDNLSVGPLTNKCAIYDTGSNTWAATGAMAKARFGHSLLVMDGGRVLVAGGRGYNPTQSTTPETLKSTEIYDVSLGVCYPGPDMIDAREFFTLTQIGSKVYATGGSSVYTEYLDLDKMVWVRSTANIGEARPYSIGVALDNGIVLSTGGMSGTSTTKSNYLFQPASDQISAGGLNEFLEISDLPGGNVVKAASTRAIYSKGTAGSITLVTAKSGSFKGPFIFNPTAGPAVTSTATTLETEITAGLSYAQIQVATGGATQFPDAGGYLVFGFGTKYQTTPVPYQRRLDADTLTLDATFVFPINIPPGTSVTLLYTKGAWVPDEPQSVGAFYLTDSPAGKDAAIKTLLDITASGRDLDITVIYPGDRGLGGEGYPTEGYPKISDLVGIYTGIEIDKIIKEARNG